MGLEIYAISNIVIKHLDPDAYSFNELLDSELNSFHINRDFESHVSDYSSAGLDIVDYTHTNESVENSVSMGSYSSYNIFRNLLSKAVLKVNAETAWNKPSKYCNKPLWDIINFSDCDGVIDCSTSKTLYNNLKESRSIFKTYISKTDSIGEMDEEHNMQLYDELIKCFKLGAEDGIIIFM